MVNYKIVLLLLIIPFFSFTNKVEQPINVADIDYQKLEKLILKKVNTLRKSKKRSLLTNHDILGLAAQDHAHYLRSRKTLSHTQRSRAKKTPMRRVDFYKGNFNYVGENVAFTYLYESVQGVRNKRNSISIRTYEQAAQYFFDLWKYSRPHYINMIDKDFTMSSIRFSYDAKSKRIYGVHVFGAY